MGVIFERLMAIREEMVFNPNSAEAAELRERVYPVLENELDLASSDDALAQYLTRIHGSVRERTVNTPSRALTIGWYMNAVLVDNYLSVKGRNYLHEEKFSAFQVSMDFITGINRVSELIVIGEIARINPDFARATIIEGVNLTRKAGSQSLKTPAQVARHMLIEKNHDDFAVRYLENDHTGKMLIEVYIDRIKENPFSVFKKAHFAAHLSQMPDIFTEGAMRAQKLYHDIYDRAAFIPV